MNIDALRSFSDRLRTEVGQLRNRGLSEAANVLESVASEHEQVLDAWYVEELSLTEAAEESGLSYSRLQQMKGINVGTSGSPRIRRCDLPFKPGRSGLQLANGLPDVAGEILTSKLAGGER